MIRRAGRGWTRSIRATLLLAAALAATAGPASAQDPEPPAPDSLDTRAKLIERLRSDGLTGPDEEGADSVPADTGRSAAPRSPTPQQGGGAMARDSLTRALLELEGYAAMEYEADSARFTADSGRVELSGEARVSRTSETMTADSLLVYERATQVVCGYGEPVLSGAAGSPVQSDQVCYDVEDRQGTATGARTEFQQGATWYLHGDSVHTRGQSRIYGRHTNFTSCDLEVPHYHFTAGDVKMVRDSVMVARNITLNFGDVPVFWLPFMMQSMKRGRRSGVLAPDFGMNDIARTNEGYERRISNVGFYWAMNDYMGARVAFEWYSGNWTALEGGLDYSWQRQFLNGDLRFRRFWRENGGRELTLRGNSRWRPTERTSVRIDGRYSSNSNFIRQNTFDPRELNRSIDSNAGIQHRFTWGSLNLSARRKQYLVDETVERTLPDVGLNLSPITLLEAPATEASWYNNATWNGSIDFTADSRDMNDSLLEEGRGDRSTRNASLSSSLQLGKVSWSQRVSMDRSAWDEVVPAESGGLSTVPLPGASPAVVGELSGAGDADTVALASALRERVEWQSNVGYQQRLIGSTTLTPSVAMRGFWLKSDSTGGTRLPGPMRLDLNASLRTDVYGFWPGVGPFSRVRHKLSPSFNYTYSPEPELTEQQHRVFGERGGRVNNRIRVSLNQTFEAKYETDDTTAAGDAAAPDTAGGGADPRPGEPRRREQAETIKVLALRTSAVGYDFVQAREEGYGLTRTRLTNNISSDLLSGLSLRVTHDLFESGQDGEVGSRTFAPFMSRVNAQFSLDDESSLFRMLGFGGDDEADPAGEGPDESADSAAVAEEEAAALEEDDDRRGMIPGGGAGMGGRAGESGPAGAGVGDWRASFRYSLVRSRGDEAGGSQMLSADMSFQPTEHWSLQWNTAYSFTDREFANHRFSLQRDLHRWTANFDFVRAQNGNFSFQFRVSLRDNPDIKMDYDQRGEALRPEQSPGS